MRLWPRDVGGLTATLQKGPAGRHPGSVKKRREDRHIVRSRTCQKRRWGAPGFHLRVVGVTRRRTRTAVKEEQEKEQYKKNKTKNNKKPEMARRTRRTRTTKKHRHRAKTQNSNTPCSCNQCDTSEHGNTPCISSSFSKLDAQNTLRRSFCSLRFYAFAVSITAHNRASRPRQ